MINPMHCDNSLPVKLLLATYDFPPVGGISVQRVVKFAKYLPHYGIQPIILTNAHGIGFVQDETLLEKNGLLSTKIYRVGGQGLRDYHLRRNMGALTPLERYWRGIISLPWLDVYSAWYRTVVTQMERITEKEGIDCVLSTSPPHSTHLIGEYLSKMVGLPWVMDLRDSMVCAPASMNRVHERMQSLVERIYEHRFFRTANAVLTVSNPMVANLKKRLGTTLSEKCTVIPNGYDEEDFERVVPSPPVVNKMVVTYTGSLQGNRSARPVLDSLLNLIEMDLIDPKKILLRFIGRFDSGAIEEFSKIRNQIELELKGHVSHSEALGYQKSSDLLLLLVTSNTRVSGSEIMTGKVYEYVASGRPIFATTVKGPLWDLIERGRFGVVCDYRDPEAIKSGLLGYYREWQHTGGIRRESSDGELAAYLRRNQAECLSKVVFSILDKAGTKQT